MSYTEALWLLVASCVASSRKIKLNVAEGRSRESHAWNDCTYGISCHRDTQGNHSDFQVLQDQPQNSCYYKILVNITAQHTHIHTM